MHACKALPRNVLHGLWDGFLHALREPAVEGHARCAMRTINTSPLSY